MTPRKPRGKSATMPATALPDDERRLTEQIEETREHLGATVEALAAKADVKARAQAKVSELTGRVKDAAGLAGQQVTTTAAQAQARLADTAAQAREKAESLAGPAADQARQRAAAAAEDIANAAEDIANAADGIAKATPEHARQAAANTASAVRARWVPLAAMAFFAVLAWVVIARRKRQ